MYIRWLKVPLFHLAFSLGGDLIKFNENIAGFEIALYVYFLDLNVKLAFVSL